MSYLNAEMKRFTVTGVDLKSTGNTVIGTTSANEGNFYPTGVAIRISNGTGITVAATVNIGTNSTAYNNIVNGLVSSTVTNMFKMATMTSDTAVVPANTTMRLNVPVATIGVGGTCIADVTVLGFYRP